jgi:hypothetical protein
MIIDIYHSTEKIKIFNSTELSCAFIMLNLLFFSKFCLIILRMNQLNDYLFIGQIYCKMKKNDNYHKLKW